MFKRIFLIVADSFGIGSMPDASRYKDEGANTLKTISRSPRFSVPCLERLGLFNIDGVNVKSPHPSPIGVYGRMTEASAGKDTVIGHWEMCGIVSNHEMPTYPDGFPRDLLNAFAERVNRGILCNRPYSGTAVIRDFGEEHLKSGKLIIYTSADSVFQIAAHEDTVPVEELYKYCQIARDMLTGENGVGRVIARPFTGTPGNFERTSRRHDYALPPPKETVLDLLKNRGYDVIAVGKINDIFASRGITRSMRTEGNADGLDKTEAIAKEDFNGLCFVNLVDFDMLYGHRNDIDGYAAAMTEFDRRLSVFLTHLQNEDLVLITGDHGCDPGFPSTDHSREYTPLLAYARGVSPHNLGTRSSFADIGKTVLDNFGIDSDLPGDSFLSSLFSVFS